MTVISERIADIGDAPIGRITFRVPQVRESVSGSRIVTERRHDVDLVDGMLTSPDLDPGPARVTVGATTYSIIIPDSATPIRLWPLIDALLPAPPPDGSGYVRSDAQLMAVRVISADDYNALPGVNPGTAYFIND